MKIHRKPLSRYFPATHPRKGEPTYFVEKFLSSINIDYTDEEKAYETAVESFHSLMDSLECWVVNPLGDEPNLDDYEKYPMPFEIDPYEDAKACSRREAKITEEWRDAESKTGNWLIIIKK